TNTYTYEDDFLKSITHNGFSYYFDYDYLGNIEKVRIDDRQLVKYFYESVPYEPWLAYTSLLKKLEYGNGDTVEYVYDKLDRIISKKYNGIEKFIYGYTSSGNIGYHKDLVNNVS